MALQNPRTLVLEEPPFLAIEILSRRDAMSDVLEKLEEYSAAWRKRAFTFSGHRLEEITGDTVSTTEPVIRISLEEVFRGL